MYEAIRAKNIQMDALPDHSPDESQAISSPQPIQEEIDEELKTKIALYYHPLVSILTFSFKHRWRSGSSKYRLH